MSLIEGVGDEVTQFFVVVISVLVGGSFIWELYYVVVTDSIYFSVYCLVDH